MSTDTKPSPEDISFEDGYDELKAIVTRIGHDDVSVHEKFEGFRRGKGLERALRGYLTDREGELTEIEEGKNLPEFRIVAASNGPAGDASHREQVELSGHGFVSPTVEPVSPATDDVPF